ncbi:MAG TPA: AIR synthase-related protein, partial [Candidatus Paceibacterota bacterium]
MARNKASKPTKQASISLRGGRVRISVSPIIPDSRAQNHLKAIRAIFQDPTLSGLSITNAYTIDADIKAGEDKKIAESLTHKLVEKYSIGEVIAPQNYSYAIEIGFLPGVTDNVGRTAQQTAEDTIGRKFKEGEAVYFSRFFFLAGEITENEIKLIAAELYNPLIARASIYKTGATFPIIVPKVRLAEKATVVLEVDLNVSDSELAPIGKEGIQNSDGTRRGPLALSLRALKIIRYYFEKRGRKPTDVELEMLAQTWSEHCKHTIFADPLDEISEGIYKRYIKGATEKIRKEKGNEDFCVSVFTDNSGAIAFDDDYLVTHKVETHNSPSALDPFGGAVTGIVGVNRDTLGFGLGAKPIANTYGFCTGNPSEEQALFRDKEKKQSLLSPRRILEGIIAGVNSGGNESGIPTPLGFLAVDSSYRGKPLVFCGTVGLIPRKSPAGSRGRPRNLDEKWARAGDYIVMIGGRVGLDGIHGATFSSESLSKGSPATSVQIGDPITQKKLSDALIREARDAGLYNSITDNGAGGLSGSVGEMARESGGCIVNLEKIPLKYPGLSPWQIWISESQERMTLAVPKKNWAKLKKIFERHDVLASRIGEFTKSGRCQLRYGKKTVADIELNFLHDGRPVEIQKSNAPRRAKAEVMAPTLDLRQSLLELLKRPNIGSISFISEQYDHEVQGNSVTKPLHGKGRVNADAAVLQPLPNSPKGIVLAHGYTPWYSEIDAYAMAASSIDTAIRNAICAGASLEYLALLDNFCWSSSDTPERLYQLKEAARACYETATAYGTPFISGKDSMFNDFKGFDGSGEKVHLAAQPTLLISALGVVDEISRAMTIDFKN